MANDSKTPAIEVRNVTKRFGAVTAVDNVSFSAAAGELFFLLGPSGCGKTTLLRILAGLETPDSGAIYFNGRDVATLAPHERGAPMVFQNYALWPHLSVKENVAFGLVERRVPTKEIAARVEETLGRVGLAGLGARMPGQLSGGQQQRVVLARALVLSPAVMLLDEPLSNLDAKLRAEMREEIEKLHRETELTFIYVTHDQTEALSLADRMAVMRSGRISAEGTPRDLYHRPPNVFCADFLGEANLLAGRVTAVEGDEVRVDTGFGAWRAVFPSVAQPAPGMAVKCLIRPENLQRAEGNGGGNRMQAEVRRLRMNGSTVTVTLQAEDQVLKATVLNRYAADLRPGLRCAWGAAAENTVVLAEE